MLFLLLICFSNLLLVCVRVHQFHPKNTVTQKNDALLAPRVVDKIHFSVIYSRPSCNSNGYVLITHKHNYLCRKNGTFVGLFIEFIFLLYISGPQVDQISTHQLHINITTKRISPRTK